MCGHRPKRKQIPVTAVGRRGAEQTFNTDTHMPRFAKKKKEKIPTFVPFPPALTPFHAGEKKKSVLCVHTLTHKVDAPRWMDAHEWLSWRSLPPPRADAFSSLFSERVVHTWARPKK